MTTKEENSQEKVFRLLVLEGKLQSEVMQEMKGLSGVTIRNYISNCPQIARERGIQFKRKQPGEKRGGGFTSVANGKPVSRLHVRVGAKLSLFRVVTERLDVKPFLERHPGLATHVSLPKMEAGQYRFELIELEQIAEMLNCSVIDLLTPTKEEATVNKS